MGTPEANCAPGGTGIKGLMCCGLTRRSKNTPAQISHYIIFGYIVSPFSKSHIAKSGFGLPLNSA